MSVRLALATLVVADYDAAIAWYVDALGFVLREDVDQGGGKRWVVVGPADGGAGLLLARGVGERQAARIGDPWGGRVGFFLETDDFDTDHAAMTARGVHFLEAPRDESYAKVAVFEDLHGNRWDLLEPKP